MIKRAISIVLLSLLASLFQGVPLAHAVGVPTWGNITSNTPNRSPDGYGCQWQFLPAVTENGSALTNYLVTISTSADYSSLPYKPTAGTVIKTDMPITPAQTSTTLLQLDRNFFSSFGAVAGTRYYFFFKPVNASGAAAESKSIGNCDVSSFLPPGVPGTPTVVAGNASATVTIVAPGASSSKNSPSSYTVSAFDNAGTVLSPAKTCTVTVPSTSCEITGLTNGTPYKFKSTASNSGGTSAASALSTSATPTGDIPPSVTNVTSSTTNGSYNVGDVISIQVTFNEAVTISGTPQITLETGSTDRAVSYTSGSGTSTLTFDYTIQAGDTSADLTYLATDALALNSGTIKSSSNLDAVLTLASPSVAGSLAANKAIVVDTTLPTVTSFSSTTSDGAYKAGAVINITAILSEAVTTASSITVTLNNGETVLLTHNSETNSLSGSYTIGSGQSSSDLGVTSYALTNAPTDAAGNVMTSTTVPAGNISGTRAIVVDTTLPTVTSFSSTTSDGAYRAGSTINITATLSEAVTAAASITATLDNGKTVVLSHNAVNNTLTGTYTVEAGDTSADLTISSYALTSAPTDAAGNVMTSLTVPSGANNLADSKAITVDTTAPSTPSTPDLDSTSDSAGASDSDNITSDNTPKINVSGSFSGTTVVTATKAGSANVTCTISSNTCTLGTLADGVWSISVTDTDAAGNASTSAELSITVDATAPTPTVATVSVTTSSGVTIRSSELGTAYLVKSTVSVTGLSSITSAADDTMNQVTISAGATDTTMSTAGLVAGDYKLYVVDAAGNLSLVSANTVTVAVAAAPTAGSTSAPTGTTTFGSTLTNAVTFNGVPTPTLTYQWKSCTNATDTATVCSDISGATGSSFIANAIELVGKFIRVLVTAINGESPNATAWSSPTVAITAVAPGVPVVGTPTLGDLQINVPVTAPASNGGSTILKYQFSTDGGATWSDRTDTATVSSPIVIKFLSTDGTTPIVAGTTYPVQIRAVNSASSPNGAGSASVSVTAAAAPGAPTAVSATASGQTTATVSFTAPANTGGTAISSYTVTSSPGGVTASGSSSPITVTGLNSGTTYTFTVVANNGAVNSVASTPSSPITTLSPPPPPPPPVCDAACVAAAAKAIADKIASDNAAKAAAVKVSVDKSAAEAAAKTAVDKAAAAVVAKAAADAAAVQAAVVAKAAADAQAVAIEAANKAVAALKSATTSAAAKAAAAVTATRAATTAANKVQAAAAAAKVAATARTKASIASKQVDIALGALSSRTAAATSAAQANAIAAAAKAAANEAAKIAADQAATAKTASNNASREASAAAARIVTEQNKAATAATEAKSATDAALKATEEKIAAATEAQKGAEAVVNALNEKIALAEASVNAKDITERAAIDKKIEEITVKVAEAQRVADTANIRAEAAIAAQEIAQTAAAVAAKQAEVQAAEVATVKAESTAKIAAATKAAADASLAGKVAAAAKAAAAKVPARAVIAAKPSTTTSKNSAKATITGLKPGQKVKVTVNVKGK